MPAHVLEGERLQKLIAEAGISSRRTAERLIVEGRVTVNGAPVTTLGARANPAVDTVLVDGRPLRPPEVRTYIALHKPAGVVSTASDERGRRTVIDLLPPGGSRVFPVGRLDRDTEGLLMLTDDGDLALRLTHPRHGVEKEYLALAERVLTAEELRRLRRGMVIDGKATAPAGVTPVAPRSQPAAAGQQWYRVTLREGHNRQIRRMFAALGVRLARLLRVRIGPVRLGDLAPGQYRPLNKDELAVLYPSRQDGGAL